MGKQISKVIGGIVKFFDSYLTLLFLTLRACDVIDWPWYWVLSPLLLSLCVFVLSCLLVGGITVLEDKL